MKPAAWIPTIVLLLAGCVAGGSATADAPGSWRDAPLTDVRTGQTFTVADLEGKLIVIEPMAIWCVNCQFQQSEVATALARGPQPNVVYLSLDVDPNERPEDLARYADESGFSWTFVVASPDVARSLAGAFGDQVLSPPATPSIVIGPDGSLIEKHLGIRGADDLVGLFEQYGQ